MPNYKVVALTVSVLNVLLLFGSAGASAQCVGFAKEACEYVSKKPAPQREKAIRECIKQYPGASGSGISICAATKLGMLRPKKEPTENSRQKESPSLRDYCRAHPDDCYPVGGGLLKVQQVAVKIAVLRKLKDPSSAVFGSMTLAPQTEKDQHGEFFVVCGWINARNSFGGYSGMTPFFSLMEVNKPVAIAILVAPDDAWILLNKCRQHGLDRF
jgi:hypothetical protein